MTSRRPPPRLVPYDETGVTSTSSEEGNGEAETYPDYSFGTDSFGPRKEACYETPRAASTPILHPRLTTFGPFSLETFLKFELDKQNVERIQQRDDPEKAEMVRLKEKATSLVNANFDLVLVEENDRKDFKVAKPSLRRKQMKQSKSKSQGDFGEDQETALASLDRVRSRGSSKKSKSDCSTRRSYTSISADVPYSPSHALSSSPRSHFQRPPRKEWLGAETYRNVANKTSSTATEDCSVNSVNVSVLDTRRTRGLSHPAARPDTTVKRDDGQAERSRANSYQTLTRSQSSMHSLQEDDVLFARDLCSPKSFTRTRRYSQPDQAIERMQQVSANDRSLSFEKHADEKRKAKRTGKAPSPTVDDGYICASQVERESRPRKAPLRMSSTSTLNQDTSTSMTTDGRNNEDLLSSQNADRSDMTAEVVSRFPESSSLNKNTLELDRDEISEYYSCCIQQHSSPRRDRDTFLTGSSDECESDPVPETSRRGAAMNLDKQRTILASVLETGSGISYDDSMRKVPIKCNYSKIVPENLPQNLRQAQRNRCKIWQVHGIDEAGKLAPVEKHELSANVFPCEALDPTRLNILSAPNKNGDFERKWEGKEPSSSPQSPPSCTPPNQPRTGLPSEIWEEGVLDFLSSAEVRSLRLVCKSIAEDLAPYVFRNVVTKFGKSMFDSSNTNSEENTQRIPSSETMFDKYGREINKFGISFEIDELGLAFAPAKVTEKLIQTWYGDYKWPVKDYPYFSSLKEIDDLFDDERRLLTRSLRKLNSCSELALSIDSGHGWLTGPDMSDLQLYQLLSDGGSKVFGKTFSAADKWHAYGLREFFKWSQANTMNENLKFLAHLKCPREQEERNIRSIVIREYDSYLVQSKQPDFERYAHTGGKAGNTGVPVNLQNHQNAQNLALGPNVAVPYVPNANTNTLGNMQAPVATMHGSATQQRAQLRGRISSPSQAPSKRVQKQDPVQPQWPIIVNGYNLAADSRGHYPHIQAKVADAAEDPLHPGLLSESQAQWLLETSWIQRTFLTAYTDGVRANTQTLRRVHSFHVSKISSGLLQSLAQDAFWSALPELRKVTILVKPDWREEHTPGDKFWHRNMAIAPFTASLKFAELLRNHIAKLENLYTLTIGFISGGEHQAGVFGRNSHILPAPITSDPYIWLTDHKGGPDSSTLFFFNHIRTLKFENCWFSPAMLKGFMAKSKDSSLHHLILDSVSLTGSHSNRTDGPLQTVVHNLKCDFSPSEWLHESLPPSAYWVDVLDKITPGKTLLDRKYDADMIDTEEEPQRQKAFRGNVRRITLNSCGYVKIHGISTSDFNQNNVVVQNSLWSSVDDGLRTRINGFRARGSSSTEPSENNNPRRSNRSNEIADLLTSRDGFWRQIMLSGRGGDVEAVVANNTERNERSGNSQYLLGKLTQCVHPVEKRILEHAWGMRFGWGDTMERWAAVDDGYFEGGTGRFGGEITADDDADDINRAQSGNGLQQADGEHEFTTENNLPSTGQGNSPDDDDYGDDNGTGVEIPGHLLTA